MKGMFAGLTMAAVTSILLAGCVAPRTVQKSIDPARAAEEAQLQRRLQLERQLKDDRHVMAVGYPILVHAVPLCGNHVGQIAGLNVASLENYTKDYQAAAYALGVRGSVTVTLVTPGSAADRASIKEGDIVRAINGWAAPVGKNAAATVIQRLKTETKGGDSVSLKVERNGEPIEIDLKTDKACDFSILTSSDDAVNAYADGRNIVITSGMLRFIENDQELATVISHELAHNAMEHMSAQRANAAVGSIFDVIAAAAGVNTQGAFGNATAKAFSKEFEAEADYVGVYALALSNLPLDETANLWRRMGSSSAATIRSGFGASHPGSAERYVAIENAVLEVRSKQAAGGQLAPSLKQRR